MHLRNELEICSPVCAETCFFAVSGGFREGESLFLFYDINIWLTGPKKFLKVLSAPKYTNFFGQKPTNPTFISGENLPKKTPLFGTFVQKKSAAQNFFLK